MEQILSEHFVSMSEFKAHVPRMMTAVQDGPLAVLSHDEVKAYLVSKELLAEYKALKFAQEMDQRDAALAAGKGVKVSVAKNGKINYF